MGERRLLAARDVEAILQVYLRLVRELPPDIEAGHLDAQGQLHFAPDMARKLRTARDVRRLLDRLAGPPGG